MKVQGKAATTPKLPPEPTAAPEREESAKPDLAAIRKLVLDELASHALEAAHAIGLSAKSRKLRPRRSGQADTTARWLIEQLFERQAGGQEAPDELSSGEGSGATVTSLVDRRRELANLLRRHRRELNK
jgi:hypothetical protein